MRVELAGMPGVGRATRASALRGRLGAPCFFTGHLLGEIAANGVPDAEAAGPKGAVGDS